MVNSQAPRPLAGPPFLCGLWRQDLGPLPALLHGALLARALPEVLLLPGPAGRPGPQLLQQGRHDPVSERLPQVGGGRLGDAVPVCGTPCPSGGRRARLGDALLHALCPHRLFGHGGACRGCSQAIPASEMVMRAQGSVYHLKCFSCATCRVRLVPGDRFHYINGTIFCEQDRPGSVLLSPTVPPAGGPEGVLSAASLCCCQEATASQQDVFSVQCWSLATCTASRARAAAAPPPEG
uniref:Si:dkey-90l8.3 n=1 Tax=Takifugu rubripes TaxID=31033 RepID=A0A674MVV1_TAKRU